MSRLSDEALRQMAEEVAENGSASMHLYSSVDLASLLAEVRQARAVAAEAEAERLRAELAVERTPPGAGRWNAERTLREATEAEVERLREALEEVVLIDCGDVCSARARRALLPGPDPEVTK